MSVRGVVVAHRETMVAQSLAAALDRHPAIAVLEASTNLERAEAVGTRADAVVLDGAMPGAADAGARLRRLGVRVVFLDPSGDDGVSVSTRDPVATLISALVPGAPDPQRRPAALTPREGQILALVARGMAGKQVARYLGISPKTVERHKTRIFAKLSVPNQTAAVSLVLSGGWRPS